MSLDTLFPLTISNTDFSLLSCCEAKWFRQRCQHLVKAGRTDINLIAGDGYAKGLELTRKLFYNEGVSAEEAIEHGYNHVLEVMGSQEIDSEAVKSPEKMALALRSYFKEYPLESDEVNPVLLEDGKHAIELKFSIELPVIHPELGVPLIFKGKLDMLANYRGQIWVFDDKTTSQLKRVAGTGRPDVLKEAEAFKASGQFIGYSWAARELGIKTNGSIVRRCAVLSKGIEHVQLELPITPFLIDLWYNSAITKLQRAADSYAKMKEQGLDFFQVFLPDFQTGCNEYFKPCPYMEGCLSKNGEYSFNKNFIQQIYDSEAKVYKDLSEFKKDVGL